MDPNVYYRYTVHMGDDNKNKKLRRCKKELQLSIKCRFNGCDKAYASKHACRLHYRLKHELN